MARWRSIGHALRDGAGGGAGEPERLWTPTDSGNLRLLLTAASFDPGVGWNDQSGRGNHYTGTGASEGNVGAVETVSFDGTASSIFDGPAMSNFSNAGKQYVVAVLKQNASPDPLTTGVWCSYQAANSTSTVVASGLCMANHSPTVGRPLILFHKASDGTSWSGLPTSGAPTDTVTGNLIMVEMGYDGDSVRIRTTNASGIADSSSNSGVATGPHDLSGSTKLGTIISFVDGITGTGNKFEGHIAALVCFYDTPNATDMSNMRTWVSRTYGLADPGSNLF